MAGDLGERDEISQRFVKSRFGWHVHTTRHCWHAGEGPLFAFTRRGAERKALRLTRNLRRAEAALLAADRSEVVRP